MHKLILNLTFQKTRQFCMGNLLLIYQPVGAEH